MFNNYNELRAALLQVVEDSSQELDAYLQTAINLAENRVVRDIDYGWLEVPITVTSLSADRVTKSLIIDSSNIPISTVVVDTFSTTLSNQRFLYFSNVYYVDKNNNSHKLSLTNESFIREYDRLAKRTGIPKYFSPINKNVSKLLVTPKPVFTGVDDHKLVINYKWVSNPMGPTTPTSLVFLKAPTLVRLAALVEVYEFLHNKEAALFYEQKYTNDLAAHINNSRREVQDEGTIHRNSQIEQQGAIPRN